VERSGEPAGTTAIALSEVEQPRSGTAAGWLPGRGSRRQTKASTVRCLPPEILFALPLIVFVLALTVAPIVDTIRLSLTEPVAGRFPSLLNYRAILESTVFRSAVANTIVVALLSLAFELGLGLSVALTLHRRFPLRGLVRTIVLIPLGVPTIVAGAAMLLVFARSGYLNAIIWLVADGVNAVGRTGWRFVPSSWIVAGGWRTLLTVAAADTWKVLPVVTLILLAGLEAIPADVYESAAIDGATGWKRFARVTLPLLWPYVTIAVVLRAIDAFRIFELALVLAGRLEPVLGTFIWNRYGPPTNDPYTASAAAIVLFGVILGFIGLYLRLAERSGEAS
jgi:ABC-type sugar transport system permease subunit